MQLYYHTGDFDLTFADDRAIVEEINQVMGAIQATRLPFISKKRLFDVLFSLAITFGAMAMIVIRFVLFAVYDASGLVIMLILACIYVGMMDHTYRKRVLEIFQGSKLGCEKVIKGLRWDLPVSFSFWIELHEIQRNQSAGQPIYIPPYMHSQSNVKTKDL